VEKEKEKEEKEPLLSKGVKLDVVEEVRIRNR